METTLSSAQGNKKTSPADLLRNRLFEKGIGHSSMSTFKSPLSTEYPNRILLVNLNSSNTSKFSPKVIRKQVAGLPQQPYFINNKFDKTIRPEERLKTTSYDKLCVKQTQFLEQLSRETKKASKAQTASNFYHSVKASVDQIQESDAGEAELLEFKRTKQLVQKLSGKQKRVGPEQIKLTQPLISMKPEKLEASRQLDNQMSKSKCEPSEITLESYIKRALKNEEGLEEFLYLMNSKNENQSQRQEDPYQLFVVEYDANRQVDQKLNRKYYTVSKKGLCYYVNSKPVQFIELEEWISEKQNYQKIKSLNFFNKFRKWKTIKMWRKIVLRHSIEECSKNLEERLFFLNPIMRHCLFEIQHINLQLGENFTILANNQDTYSLQNFKAVQEKNKRKISNTIQEGSQKSRASVRRCFEDNLKILRESMKEKQKEETEEKVPNISSHINLKDSAFQALGFPPKMSYENRSRLRKLAGKFIRFAYLVDILHTAGLALHFKTQLSEFISALSESQCPTNLQIMMTAEDKNSSNSVQTQTAKLFHVKLALNVGPIPANQIVYVSFPENEEGNPTFNPLYHIKLSNDGEEGGQREYCPTICNQWLFMTPRFEDIYREVGMKLKQSLQCLKQFERWSKHREIEKFINILEEWDDVVSQSREVTENQNLDPASIITGFQNSLNEVKAILAKSLQTINSKLKKEFTQFLNMYWEQQRINLQLFRSPDLQSPAQTIENFLKYITSSMAKIEKQIPYRIRLSAFEINLGEIRTNLLRKAETTFENFKELLPEVVEERTKYVNDWLNKYITEICKKPDPESLNIDLFVSKIKNIREAEQTFDKKKELCLDLTAIQQIMDAYKFSIKKKKDPENDTLKLKEILDSQINSTFQEGFKKQAQFYSREVYKNYLPNIVKDISRLSTALKNSKYTSLAIYERSHHDLMKQIEELQRRYEELAQRNMKCGEYQQILNQFHGVQQEMRGLKQKTMKQYQDEFNQIEQPSYFKELLNAKQEIECLKGMWQMYQKWSSLVKKYNDEPISHVLDDKEKLIQMLNQESDFIQKKLKGVLGANEVVEELCKKVEIFSKHLPIIVGLNKHLSETHWQQINELVRKNCCSISLDSQKLVTLQFSDFVGSGIGQFKDQLEEIFVKASNEIQLQVRYEEMERRWKNYAIKTRVQGKFVVIYDQAEHTSVIELVDQALSALTDIFSNPYSFKLQLGVLTIESILGFLETYQKWTDVQQKLLNYDRICRCIDMKKITQANALENSQKQYKAIFKTLLPRNIDTSFSILKLVPSYNPNINEKFQECERMLNNLQGSIKNMLQEYRKNSPIYYQLEDNELLRVIMQTNPQQTTSNLASLVEEFICHRFLKGVVKQIKVEGQRITAIVSIDGENLSKSEYALSSDLSGILNEVIEAVNQYTRRTMKACKIKSQQASLYQMVDEFNIQFLLAISKVDFSNYTGISIENRQENSESLREYWKIMAKDTKNGIRKLKQKKSGNVLGYENLILQNLLHQEILQDLVKANIRCANEYEWIKYLRFYWEDNEESNVSIKKMHVSLRYGKEYIGSNSKVLIESNSGSKNSYQNLDMIMSIIRCSQAYCYLGNYERLQSFTNCIAHRLQKISCTKQMGSMFGNPIKTMLKAKFKADCCYFVESAHLLSDQAITEILAHQSAQNSYAMASREPIKMNMTEQQVVCYYNPIFLHFPVNKNTLLRVNRLQYRSVSLVAPSDEFLVCYLYLMLQVISNYMICQAQTRSNTSQTRCGSRSGKHGKTEVATEKLMISPKETVILIKKFINWIEELEVTDNNRQLCIQSFLESAKHRICGLTRTGTPPIAGGVDMKIFKLVNSESEPRPNIDLHQILIEMFLEYVQPLVRHQNLTAILEYVGDVYPQFKNLSYATPPSKSMIQVDIVVGYRDCLSNRPSHPNNEHYINLAEHSIPELYGFQTRKGLLHKIINESQSNFSKTIVINGINQKLVVYLSALIEEYAHRSNNMLNCTFQDHLPKKNSPSQKVNENGLKSGFVLGDLGSINDPIKSQSKTGGNMIENSSQQQLQPLSIEIRACQLSQVIDPKLVTQFRISAAVENFRGGWNYVQQRIERWIFKVCSQYKDQQQKSALFATSLQKFYRISIKGLWKDLHKIFEPEPFSEKSQSVLDSRSTLSETMINLVRDFLNFMHTLVPVIFRSSNLTKMQCSRLSFQRTVVYASIYSLCHVYQSAVDRDSDYIKFESIFEKLQAESWLCIPESERIRPSEYQPVQKRSKTHYSKKRYTLFDYIFDGAKLIPLDEYSNKSFPERMIERGEFYLTNDLIHLSLITERTLEGGNSGVLLLGRANSGKSTFCKVYKAQHFSETAYLTVYAYNKNKTQVYNRICKVLSLTDLNTIGPKVNFNRSLIVIDDLSMPSTETNFDDPENKTLTQLACSLSSFIKKKAIITPLNYQKFKLKNVGFIINLASGSKNSMIHPDLDECTIKYNVGDRGENSMVRIFEQILKANVLDPEIQECTFVHLVKVAFDIYRQIWQVANRQVQSEKTSVCNTLNLQILKRMTLFTAHLRFKQNTSSLNQLTRFWAYLIKDNLEVHCVNYGIEFNSLASVRKETTKQSGKSIFEYLKQPIQELLYSHLYVKQQVYGNGKEVQYYGEIRKLYNSINQTIHDYNATESKHRYGYYFGLIAIDELINKIVKISNMLLTGDYAIFSRKGSQVSALIRLVSFILGFNYKEKAAKKQTIIDIVRETIVELTKVSLYLISVKIDDSNIDEFIDYYQCDFEAEIIGSLQAEDLHFIQASGAFDFGITQSQNHCTSEGAGRAILAWQQKNQQKSTSTPLMKHVGSHSHSNSKEQLEGKAKAQDQTRFNKLSLREINKMKRSIRLVYQFESQKYVKCTKSHLQPIPQHILSQLNVDFFQEYPRESIIRFSEQSLGMGTQSEKMSDDNIIGCANDKFHIMFEIYSKVRTELGLALNQYEECHRLYWYLVGNLSNDIKQNITKYELIFDLNQKLQEIIGESVQSMEVKWQEKIGLSARVNQIKESPSQDSIEKNIKLSELTSIESKLSELNLSLQQLTQKRSLCEKMVSFFKPTLPEFKRRYDLLQSLISNNSDRLKINCLVIASYFTYLSKLPFENRKPYLQKWYFETPSLCKIEPSQRLTSVSQFFSLVTEEYMIINKQNEPFYENMMIILNSSRAVLIRDNKKKGRDWIATFDDSFASVSESSSDYLQKLEEYLAAGRNIFLEITNQETLNNSLSNQIHNLIFMEENASTVKIGETEYNVSNKTKVFIVVAPHLTIPEEILNENLYIIYEQSESDLIRPLEHQLMLLNNGDKYTQYLEYRKRQQSIMNECYNLEIPLANVVFDQIYADIDNLDSKQERPDQDDEIKKLSIEQKKTKEELMGRIEFLSKVGALDKHQERFDRYFTKKKQLEEVRDKIYNMDLISSYNHIRSGNRKGIGKTPLQKVLNIIRGTYNLIEKLKTSLAWFPDMNLYYEVLMQALKQGLIIINLGQFEADTQNHRYNIGMFALFILRQWGQRVSRNVYLVLALSLMVIIDVEMTNTQLQSSCSTFTQLLQSFIYNLPHQPLSPSINLPPFDIGQQSSTSLLSRLSQYMACHSYSTQSLQSFLVENLQQSIGQEYWEQVVCQNSMPNAKWSNRPNKIDQFVVEMAGISKNDGEDEQINEVLRHVVVLTGNLAADFNEDEYANAVDSEMYANWQYRKSILKIIDTETAFGNSPMTGGVAEIKNTQAFESEIKKILHDKTGIFLPIIKTALTPHKVLLKSQTLLSSLLTEVATKYPLSRAKVQMKSKANQTMNSSHGRGKINSQGTDGASHLGVRIHEDFRIYIYHYDVLEVTKMIADTLNMDLQTVRQQIFIRDISNVMVFNCEVSKLIKGKIDAREKPEEQGQSQKNYVVHSGQISNNKNTGCSKTKRQIQLEGDEKEKQPKNKSRVPSMRNLEQQINNLNATSVENHQNSTNPNRTNKAISNQPNAHHTPSTSRLVQNINRAANLLFCYIQRVIELKTWKADLGNNFYNKWFISDSYFNCMEKLLQPISLDNESWTFYHTVSVMCKVAISLVNSCSNLYFHRQISRFLTQLSAKLQDLGKTLLTSPTKLPSTTVTDEKSKTEIEGQKVLQFLANALNDELLQMINNSNGMITQQKINNLKIQSQMLCFESTCLSHMRQFLQLEPRNFNFEVKFDEDESAIIKLQGKHDKRTINKKLKSYQVDLNFSKSKSCLAGLKRSSTLKQGNAIAIDQEQSEIHFQKKLLNEITEFLFKRDAKTIKIKSNLIRSSIDESKKLVASQKFANSPLVLSIFYDLVLLKQGYVPPYISSFIRSTISYQDGLTLNSLIKKMTSIKVEYEKQKKQMKNPNFAIDFGLCTNPIQMIKAYMRHEFEEKAMRVYMDINEQSKQPQRRDEGDVYCVCLSLTPQELKQNKFIRLKNLWAIGWRLNSDSTCEMTQQDKVTLLSNAFITKRKRPTQQAAMSGCEIVLLESEMHLKEIIRVYAFTKKTQLQKKISKVAYLKCPKQSPLNFYS